MQIIPHTTDTHPARSYQDKNLDYSITLIRNTTTRIKEVSITMLNFSSIVVMWNYLMQMFWKLSMQVTKFKKQTNKTPAFSLNILELQHPIRQKCQYSYLFTVQNSNSVVVHIHSRDKI